MEDLTGKTTTDLVERLRDAPTEELMKHEDVATMTIGGKEYKWLICRRGLRLAKGMGLDVDGLFASLNSGARPETRFASTMESVSDLVMVGLLPFYEDAEAIVDAVSLQDLGRLAPQIKEAFASISAEAAAGKAEAQGAADRKKGRR